MPGSVIEAPVGHVDLLPTLLNLTGGMPEEPLDLPGRSLLDLMLQRPGADGAHQQVFQEVMYEGPTTRKAVVTSDWHYIRNVEGREELYDLSRDPVERHNLAGDSARSEIRRSRTCLRSSSSGGTSMRRWRNWRSTDRRRVSSSTIVITSVLTTAVSSPQ